MPVRVGDNSSMNIKIAIPSNLNKTQADLIASESNFCGEIMVRNISFHSKIQDKIYSVQR